MRGVLPGEPSPFPLVHRLPGVLQEDEFLVRFLDAFDEALAPIFLTLDALGAYVDPELAPADFLDWVAGWVGVSMDETTPVDRRREIVAGAVTMHTRRGTVAGIAAAVRMVTGGEVEVTDNGGAAFSGEHGGTLPGRPGARLQVRVHAAPGTRVDEARISALVAAVKPAHVPHEVKVVTD